MMVLNKIDTAKYKEDFSKKFNNFGEKAPIMISFVVEDIGVTIVHVNSEKSYFYEWDFTIPVKAFIHKIKQDLSYYHYPRLLKEVEVEEKLSDDQVVSAVLDGSSLDDAANKIIKSVKSIVYRIDKVLMMKDQFILIDEASGDSYCYQLNGSSVYFLKNYRNGVYKDIKEAGDYFFKNAREVAKLKK